MARRRPRLPAARPHQPAQPPMAQLHRPRRHLHARRLGIPVVRLLGPRLSHHPVLPLRSRPGQAPTQAPAQGMVYASQRTPPRLRVELRRPEPSRLCLGRTPHLLRRCPPHRTPRPDLPRARLSRTTHQLHLVVQRRLHRRPTRSLWRRFPRPRQCQPLQPQRAAPRWRLPRAKRRHQLDGHVCPQHAPHRP